MTTLPPSKDPAVGENLLLEMFAYAEHSVFLTTLPNDRGTRGGLRHERLSPVAALLENRDRVISKYDRDGQAIYFCVSTLDQEKINARAARVVRETGKEPLSARAEETIAEILVAHVDIDLKNLKLGFADVCHRLMDLQLRPSFVVFSGHGVHAYWRLKEAIIATPDFIIDHKALLSRIAFVTGGDKACAEPARLMRVPGSHNTKGGEWIPVTVSAEFSDPARTYDWQELSEFFDDCPRVVTEAEVIQNVDPRTGRSRPATDGAGTDNPFAAYVRAEVEAGRVALPPIDVERMLQVMTPGDGDYGVHVVTRTVTASLVSRGWTAEDIVPFVIGGIEAMIAANGLPQGWAADWQASEERKVIGQIDGFVRKQTPEKLARVRERRAAEKRADAGAALEAKGEHKEQIMATGTDNVVPFEISRRRPGRPRKEPRDKPAEHVELARHTLERMRREGRDIAFSESGLWEYREGLWRAYLGDDKAFIEAEISATVIEFNLAIKNEADDLLREKLDTYDETAKLRTETRRYIRVMPDLQFRGDWDSHGLVPLANGLFDPDTRSLTPYAPQHRATYRFAADYDPGVAFTNGQQMIRDLFRSYGPEADGYVLLIQQVFYVALMCCGKTVGRQLRRCLYLQGLANSGKSQITNLIRSAIGKNHCSAVRLDDLDQQFAVEGILRSAAWIVDEAANERTRIDAATLKALLAEDRVRGDRKNRAPIEKSFLGAAIFNSNSYPRTLDTGSGFSDRVMVVSCPETFNNEAPTGVAALAHKAGYATPAEFIAATELAGLVNWVLQARDRVEAQRKFDQPAAVVAARDEIARKANPVAQFVKDCLEDIPGDYPLTRASRSADVVAAFRTWHFENGDVAVAISDRELWLGVNAALGGRRGGKVTRALVRRGGGLVVGQQLSTTGLSYWDEAKQRRDAGDSKISPTISSSSEKIVVDVYGDETNRGIRWSVIKAVHEYFHQPLPYGLKEKVDNAL